jgi:CTP:molybdopterin cytidylyltransferase MocA
MLENKLLLPWRDGSAIVRHVASKYVQASIGQVVVVTGRDASRVRAVLADLDVICIHNPDFATGEILSSVKVGLRALADGLGLRRHKPVGAAFIQPADMPCVPGEVIGKLAAAHEAGWNVAPQYKGRRGHPVLLDRKYWAAMLALADGMPRDVIQAARERLRLVDVEDEGVLVDVDTREAYERAIQAGTAE